MANSTTHAALPYPIKNARFSLEVPFLDADGDPTDPTTPDTEFSLDNAAFADCAEEVTTTSGSNGVGYITLSGAETNGSMVALAFKVASGPKATLATLYPRVLASVGTGTLSAGSAGGGTLGTLLAYDVTGCFIQTTGGTGGGGTGGANNQARKIVTYNTSTGAFTVSPNWETTPSTDTTYSVLLPEGVTLGMLKALNPTTAGRTLDVASTGEAGIDLANVAAPSAASAYPLGVLWYGTLSSVAATSVTLPGGHGLDVEGNYAIVLVSGTNAAGKSRYLTFSTGATWTVDPAWTSDSETTPSGTVVAYIIAAPKIPTSAIPKVDVTKISGDSTAADNAESFFDGTGYAGTNNVIPLVTTTTTATNLTNAPTAGDLTATMKTSVTTAASAATPALSAAGVDAIWDETLSGHSTAGTAGKAVSDINTNTDTETSASSIRAAIGLASANLDTQLDALPTNAELSTALGTADDAVLAALVTLTALVDDLEGRLTAARAGYLDNLNPAAGVTIAAAGSLALTEGYAADGATATLPQLLYAIKALLSEFAITGTTLQTKRLDGTTNAEAYTLNHATTPTGITRSG